MAILRGTGGGGGWKGEEKVKQKKETETGKMERGNTERLYLTNIHSYGKDKGLQFAWFSLLP